jgi:hypothetical protein
MHSLSPENQALRKCPKYNGVSKGDWGFIYVLRGANGWCKIGKTHSPAERIDSYSPKLPFPVELAFIFISLDMHKAERLIHKHFAAKRSHGEWFVLSDEDLAWFKTHPLQIDISTYHCDFNGDDDAEKSLCYEECSPKPFSAIHSPS